MPTLQNLLASGYFARELPPSFSTASFANAVTGPNDGLVAQISTVAGSPRYAEMCVHNMVRSGGLRRHLGIPNPVHYSRQCSFIVQHWAALQQSAHRSPFSLTKPVDTGAERAITGSHDFTARTMRRAELRASGRFLIHADINRFYPSVYTHSIPWAIEGKNVVKHAKATNTLNTIWSDRLDTTTRNMNDQQTVGIPIGPDTSLLLAECVLAAVDEELNQTIPGLRGIRFIDDYEFVTNKRSEAEVVVSTLQSILSKFELALNPTKTQIIELPHPIEPLWTSRLRTFVFRDAGTKGQRTDLTAYFDNVFALARGAPDETIFKYAIPRLNAVDLAPDNWQIFQYLLSQCARCEPACLPQVCDQIFYYQSNQGLAVDIPLWTVCLEQTILERLPLGQASEALWALWMMRCLGISMSESVVSAIDTCDDSPVALMALSMSSYDFWNEASFPRLQAFAEPSELFGRHWLLCYESNKQGWLTPPSGVDSLGAHPQFDFLRSQNVSFFNINALPRILSRYVPGSGGGGGSGEY